MRSPDSGPSTVTAPPLAVILAAGEGTRLRSGRSAIPKPLVRLRGLSLAERSIAQLLAEGVERFVVVLGCEAERVRSEFERISRCRRCQIAFVVAEDWQKGNGRSAAAAAQLVGNDPFLLTMVDHLLSPEMIRQVLADPPSAHELTLAIDRDIDSVFDVSDLTKVETSNGRVASVGKDLPRWSAGDTGLFYCSSKLFDGLSRAHGRGRFSLTDGVRECVANGGVRTIDVTGERWLDVDTPEAFREALQRIDTAMAKGGEDGFVSQYLNRPLSRRLSVAFASTPLTPNHITALSFLMAMLGAVGLATTIPWLWVAAGVLIQTASILDGCDGEIARIKLLQSPQGAWLDTVLDRYSDLAIGLAVTFAASHLDGAAWIWPAGFAATASFLMASYVTKEFQIRFGHPYPNNLVTKLKRRDLRILVIAVGSVLGHPLTALLAIGFLTHLTVLQILVSGWHTRHVSPRAVTPLLNPRRASVDILPDIVTGTKRDGAMDSPTALSLTGGVPVAPAAEPLEHSAIRVPGEQG